MYIYCMLPKKIGTGIASYIVAKTVLVGPTLDTCRSGWTKLKIGPTGETSQYFSIEAQ